jgi:hypothetical protein
VDNHAGDRMETAKILPLYDQQQRIDITFPDRRKEVTPEGVVRFVRPTAGMNFISYSRLSTEQAEAVITDQIDYFVAIGQPFEWRVFAHDQPADMLARLGARGFDPGDPIPVLVLDLAAARAELLDPAPAEVRRLTRPEELEDVIRVEETVWGTSMAWMRERMGGHLAVPGYLDLYAAYMDGQSVSTAWTYFNPGSQFAGLFGGSTLEEFRGRGLYQGLLRARAQAAMARGYRFLLIEPTEMSRPIVARLGFRLLAEPPDCAWVGPA